MLEIFAAIIGEQLGIALILYPIVWFIVRRKGGKKTKLANFSWHILGYFVVGLGVGIIRYLTIFIVGIQPVLQLENPVLSYSFVLILPILLSIGIAKWNIRFHRKTNHSSTSSN